MNDLTRRCCIQETGDTSVFRDGNGIFGYEQMTQEQKDWEDYYDQGNVWFYDTHNEGDAGRMDQKVTHGLDPVAIEGFEIVDLEGNEGDDPAGKSFPGSIWGGNG
ncbi:MAG: hypothetical protein M1812_003297 [Candelaria pacifica]|nr:MAG: hypothetical protein M1812_003297 [Candelaria pacifica]